MIFPRFKALSLKKLLKFTIVLLSFFVLKSSFFLVSVDSRSMEPTLNQDDKVLLIHKRFSSIQRNDIVLIFPENDMVNFPLLKRVRAIPNDFVEIRDEKLYINHVFVERIGERNSKPLSITLLADQYFIMGDWLDNSMDSRNFGPITYDEIKGKVIYMP